MSTTSGEISSRFALLPARHDRAPGAGRGLVVRVAEIGRRPVVVLFPGRRASVARTHPGRAVYDHNSRGIASEVVLEPSDDPIPQTSVVNLDAVESVSLATLVERLGRLSDERMRQICRALEIAVACEG